jgi:hypothetical protein
MVLNHNLEPGKTLRPGQTRNHLTFLEDLNERNSNQEWVILVRCVCGATKKVSKSKWISGYTKSCGCRQRKKRKAATVIDIQPNPKKKSKKKDLYRIKSITEHDGYIDYHVDGPTPLIGRFFGPRELLDQKLEKLLKRNNEY